MPCEAWWDCFFDMLVNALRYIKDVVVDTRAYASCGVCVWLYKVYIERLYAEVLALLPRESVKLLIVIVT
jgi:hypothetical protein